MLRSPAIEPFSVVADSVRLAIAHRRAYVRLAALPFAVCVVLLLWAGFRGGTPLVGLTSFLFSLAVMLPVATAWHRFVVLGRGLDPAELELRVGPAELRYALTWGKLTLAAAAFALPLVTMAAIGGGSSFLAVLAMAAAVLAPVPFLTALPEAAVGGPARLRDAEELSRGNRGALAALTVGLVLAAMILNAFAAALPGAGFFGVVSVILSELAAFALLPVWTGALSLAYLKLSPSAPLEG